MSVSLLDVNVLIALLWEEHSHHEAAMAWFSENQSQGWATCPLTQAGFVRVISNPKGDKRAPGPARVIEFLETALAGNPHHQFWPDSLPLGSISPALRARIVGHNQITDAYLLTLSAHKKARLITFDQGVRVLAPKGSAEERFLRILK